MVTEIKTQLEMPQIPGVDHQFLEIHDGSIHIATMGQGQPLVLLPGLGQSWLEWREIMPSLAAAGYRVIAPDLRGEGWTDLPINALSRTQRSTDVLEMLDALNVGSAILVGHDLGAVTAYQLAFAAHDRVERLVMMAVPPPQMKFDPALLPGLRHLWHQEALATPGLGRKLMTTGIMARHFFSELFLTRPLDPAVFAQYDALMRHPQTARAAELVCRRIVLPELSRIMAGSYRKQRLSMPTLFLFGSEDSGFPVSVLNKVFAQRELIGPDIHFELIDGAGHFLIDEEPISTLEAVKKFLDQSS